MSNDWAADRIRLTDVMLRYARGVDERDFAMYRACFTDDAEILGFGPKPFHGGDAWRDYVIGALDAYSSTQHMLGPQLATIDGDTAHCRTDVQAWHCLKDPAGQTFTLWATYETDMVRVGGDWKICRHRLVTRGSHTEPAPG